MVEQDHVLAVIGPNDHGGHRFRVEIMNLFFFDNLPIIDITQRHQSPVFEGKIQDLVGRKMFIFG